MKMTLQFIFVFFICLHAKAEVDHDIFQLQIEGGSSYHSVKGKQSKNNAEGILTSVESAFFRGSFSFRLAKKVGLLFYGASSLVQFEKSPKFELKNRNLPLFTAGLEAFWRAGRNARIGFFIEQQSRPLYTVNKPGELKMFTSNFIQPGVNLAFMQDRRTGLLWNFGTRLFVMTPSQGGAIATESGAGAEAYARLGFVGFAGTQFHLKGSYQIATAPNAEVEFTHDELGFSAQLTKTF